MDPSVPLEHGIGQADFDLQMSGVHDAGRRRPARTLGAEVAEVLRAGGPGQRYDRQCEEQDTHNADWPPHRAQRQAVTL
jgi:hypothetical protein